MGLYEYFSTMHDVCLDVAKTCYKSSFELASFYFNASQSYRNKAENLSLNGAENYQASRWQLKRLEELENFKAVNNA